MSISWDMSPAVAAEKLNRSAALLPKHVATNVFQTLQEGAYIMERAILTRGQRNGVITGARIRTGAMFESVDAKMTSVGSIVSGDYGYLMPPDYTIFQEKGTSRGIIAVGALIDGAEYVRRNISARLLTTSFWEL